MDYKIPPPKLLKKGYWLKTVLAFNLASEDETQIVSYLTEMQSIGLCLSGEMYFP
jgi:hypothetical protein